VDSVDSICHTDCSFEYVSDPGSVDSVSSDSTNITITGTNLPST